MKFLLLKIDPENNVSQVPHALMCMYVCMYCRPLVYVCLYVCMYVCIDICKFVNVQFARVSLKRSIFMYVWTLF